MGKLWEKNYTLDAVVERFTVGNDFILDRRLVAADCVASLAHARGLERAGLLGAADAETLKKGLLIVLDEVSAGHFEITVQDEDCHTAIENRLVVLCGEAGKKIHTGRSRNDQILVTLRVWGREAIAALQQDVVATARVFLDFARRQAGVPMPGRTHMQIAMPSSVGLWAASFAESLLDDLAFVRSAASLFDQCPLGSAAGYGVPLPLDRDYVAGLLAFRKTQNNVIYAQNSRGKFEAMILDALNQVMLTLSKCAWDLILFSLPEFGYFSLPARLCTGSSIMPQKKNPDGLELLRAKASVFDSFADRIRSLVRGLPTGYNRDFQDTKEPFMAGLELVRDCLAIARLTMENTEVDAARLRAAFTPEIYATDAAFEKVRAGASFRDAYREVGLSLDKLGLRDPDATILDRTSRGTAGDLRLDETAQALDAMEKEIDAESAKRNVAFEALMGRPVAILG